jgi:transcriptional regulator with XRE-family HTH domain
VNADALPRHIAQKMRILRRANGHSQLQLARLSGVSRANINRCECAVAVPKLTTLEPLARFYNVPIAYFFQGYK